MKSYSLWMVILILLIILFAIIGFGGITAMNPAPFRFFFFIFLIAFIILVFNHDVIKGGRGY